MEQVPIDSPQSVDPQQPIQTPQPPFSIETPQPTPVIPPESPKKWRLKPFIIVVIFGLLAGGVGIAYMLINKGGITPQSEKQKISTTPTVTPKVGISVSDNFEGADLNEEMWYSLVPIEQARVEQRGGKIEIEIPSGFTEETSALLELTTLVEGDFEIQVDTAISSGGEPGGSESALVFHNDEGDWINQIVIFLRKEEDGVYVRSVRDLDGSYEILDFAKRYDYAGPFTLKMQRKDGKVTFSVKPAESATFESIGQLTPNFYQGRGRITLFVNTYGDNYPAVLSTFDNFNLTQF